VYFGGWARMAQPIVNFAVVEVAKPDIGRPRSIFCALCVSRFFHCDFVSGEERPSCVRADITVNLNVRREVKAEWENLRKHDVCFLITVKPTQPIGRIFFFLKSLIHQISAHRF